APRRENTRQRPPHPPTIDRMHARSAKQSADREERQRSQRTTPGLLDQRSLNIERDQPLPAVHLRSARYHPFIYRKMVERAEPAARPGDLVAVHDRAGALFGYGLYNPRSEIAVRMLTHGAEPPGESFWHQRI